MNVQECGCGKVAYTSKAAAGRAVVGAKIRRDLHGEKNRREDRAYRCPGNRNLWHLTSQSGRFSPLPTYPDSDDEAARVFVARQVDHPREEVWDDLLDDDRVHQTVRVLCELQQEVITARANFAAMPPAEKTRALAWETAILARLRAARAAEKAANIRKADQKKDDETRQNHYALRQLTLAVARHQRRSGAGTAADRELWKWLDTLVVANGGRQMSLGELVDEWQEETW